MDRLFVNLGDSDSKRIGALESSGTAAAFSDAVRVETGDAVLLYVSGQTPIDDSGTLVGKTMYDQTIQVLERIRRILEHEGARMTDIVRVRVFTTDIHPEALRQIHQARNRYFPAGARPASTLVQVSGIIRDRAMIEIDADAVIGRRDTA